MTFTLVNSSSESFDPTQLSLAVTSNDQQVLGVVDSAKNMGMDPSAVVLPGRTLKWSEAYAVVPGKNLTIQVDTPAGPVATWDGVIH